ncbi:MAG TPA: hypothetical protein VFQ68_20110 [Streptosporangiaceae bacterium]|nr:hypothetical protein [Streptosporangiaceae bacterium]
MELTVLAVPVAGTMNSLISIDTQIITGFELTAHDAGRLLPEPPLGITPGPRSWPQGLRNRGRRREGADR